MGGFGDNRIQRSSVSEQHKGLLLCQCQAISAALQDDSPLVRTTVVSHHGVSNPSQSQRLHASAVTLHEVDFLGRLLTKGQSGRKRQPIQSALSDASKAAPARITKGWRRVLWASPLQHRQSCTVQSAPGSTILFHV
eukprot:6480303-Amphidinium_carterae.1